MLGSQNGPLTPVIFSSHWYKKLSLKTSKFTNKETSIHFVQVLRVGVNRSAKVLDCSLLVGLFNVAYGFVLWSNWQIVCVVKETPHTVIETWTWTLVRSYECLVCLILKHYERKLLCATTYIGLQTFLHTHKHILNPKFQVSSNFSSTGKF